MISAMFTMVLLTIFVGLLALRARFASVRMRQIDLGYFRLMQAEVSQQVPERVAVTTRSMNNMYEVPVLFYIVGVLSLAMGHVTPFTLIVAWLFVLSRCIHAWIHLTYNNVFHRMAAFLTGLILVLALWIEQVILAL